MISKTSLLSGGSKVAFDSVPLRASLTTTGVPLILKKKIMTYYYSMLSSRSCNLGPIIDILPEISKIITLIMYVQSLSHHVRQTPQSLFFHPFPI